MQDDDGAWLTDDLLLGLDVSRGKPKGLPLSGKPTWVTQAMYGAMKNRFELEGNFFALQQGNYACREETGAIRFFRDEKSAAKAWRLNGWKWGTGVVNLPFSSFYLNDSEARVVRKITYTMDIADTGKGDTFYTRAVFQAEVKNLAYAENSASYQRSIALFKELLSINSSSPVGGEAFLYVQSFFAFVIQKRHVQQGIALVLTGEQGAGKDTLLKVFKGKSV